MSDKISTSEEIHKPKGNEGRNYFLRLGRFTEEELERLEDGEVITKGGNEFRIEKED